MKTRAFVLISLLVLTSVASAQDNVLKQMTKDAEIVVHVKVLAVQGGAQDEQGVQEWAALCEVVEPVKGPIEKGEIIRFRFNRFEFLDHSEPMLVEEGKEYVVFLKGKEGGVRFESDDKLHTAYTLLDRWVGALPYRFHLVQRLKEHLKES
ncbi:MAG: hypothetical protein JW889_16325 [Verrucomicrobia bacterium]|nr:hypothetical protein [Verrucomicrobiota bacterium]